MSTRVRRRSRCRDNCACREARPCAPGGNCYDYIDGSGSAIANYFKVVLPSGKEDRAGRVSATWGSFASYTVTHDIVPIGVNAGGTALIFQQLRFTVSSTGRTLTHDMILGATNPCSVEARAANQGTWAGNWSLGGPVEISSEVDDLPSSYDVNWSGFHVFHETRNYTATIEEGSSPGEAFVTASAGGANANFGKTLRIKIRYENRTSTDGGVTWSGWIWRNHACIISVGWSASISRFEENVPGPYTFDLSGSVTGTTTLILDGVTAGTGATPTRTMTASIVVSATSESPSQLVFLNAPPRLEVLRNTTEGPVVIEQLIHPCETIGCQNAAGKSIESRRRLWTAGSVGFASSRRAIERLGPGGLWFYRPPGTGFFGGFYYLGSTSSPVLASAPIVTSGETAPYLNDVRAITPQPGDCCADETSSCRPCRQCLTCASAYRVRVECVDGSGAVVETVADVVVTQLGGIGKACSWSGSSAGKTVIIGPTSTTTQDRLRLEVFAFGVVYRASQPSVASRPCCPVASSFTSIEVPYSPPPGSTLRVTIE